MIAVAKENRTWGYGKIQGALKNLGYEISMSSIASILDEEGIEPTPERSRRLSWSQFLKSHWYSLAAADFFTVEVCHGFQLIRYSVLFVIDLPTRKVEILGIAPDPGGQWMKQVARNLADCIDGFLMGIRYLIHDHDPLFTYDFKQILKSTDIKCVCLPARSPNLNAYAERFVRSIKYECLNNFIFFSEKQLRHVIREYIEHYNRERNHQGINNELIDPEDSMTKVGVHTAGEIKCRERLGGMLKYYHRAA